MPANAGNTDSGKSNLLLLSYSITADRRGPITRLANAVLTRSWIVASGQCQRLRCLSSVETGRAY
jgi:hypothetical protein